MEIPGQPDKPRQAGVAAEGNSTCSYWVRQPRRQLPIYIIVDRVPSDAKRTAQSACNRMRRSNREGSCCCSRWWCSPGGHVVGRDLTRYSLSWPREAHDARQQLQRRWGIAFALRTAVFSRPGGILAAHARHLGQPGRGPQAAVPAGRERAGWGSSIFGWSWTMKAASLISIVFTSRGGRRPCDRRCSTSSRVPWRCACGPARCSARSASARPFESWGQVYAVEELPAQ